MNWYEMEYTGEDGCVYVWYAYASMPSYARNAAIWHATPAVDGFLRVEVCCEDDVLTDRTHDLCPAD